MREATHRRAAFGAYRAAAGGIAARRAMAAHLSNQPTNCGKPAHQETNQHGIKKRIESEPDGNDGQWEDARDRAHPCEFRFPGHGCGQSVNMIQKARPIAYSAASGRKPVIH